MKFSLAEIKKENERKISYSSLPNSSSTPKVEEKTRAIVKYEEKKKLSPTCKKHTSLHQNCARIGIQRTKSNRWRRTGEGAFLKNAFVSDLDLDRLEEMYSRAKKAFHDEPCTC